MVVTKGRGAGKMVHDGITSQPISRSLDRTAALSNAVVPKACDVTPVAVAKSDGWAESDNVLRSIISANDDCKSPLAP